MKELVRKNIMNFMRECGQDLVEVINRGDDYQPIVDKYIDNFIEEASPTIKVKDDRLDDAVRLIMREKVASTSLLQRRLQLGYNRACRIMAQLEKIKVVGRSRGSKPRDILIDSYDQVDYSILE